MKFYNAIKGVGREHHQHVDGLLPSVWIHSERVNDRGGSLRYQRVLGQVERVEGLKWFDVEDLQAGELTELIRQARETLPDVEFSFYGVPGRRLLLPLQTTEYRINHKMSVESTISFIADTEPPEFNRGKDSRDWLHNNFLALRDAAQYIDYYCPPFYGYYKDIEHLNDWKVAVDVYIELLAKYYPEKPLIPFISPVSTQDMSFNHDYWTEQLDYLDGKVDGALVWTPGNFNFNEEDEWFQILKTYMDTPPSSGAEDTPSPEPSPTPEPNPNPTPEPTPEPTPNPEPAPEPEPAPNPEPES